ncbi:MAG TPA: hypothetical protein VGC19_14945 [Rhodanobacter sp.]
MSRAALVTELVRHERAVTDILRELAPYGWDCDSPLVQLLPEHIVDVLDRFLSGELSADQVDAWANAIECREDIGYDPSSVPGKVLHELANAALPRAHAGLKGR